MRSHGWYLGLCRFPEQLYLMCLQTFQTALVWVWTSESVHIGDSCGHWTHLDLVLLEDLIKNFIMPTSGSNKTPASRIVWQAMQTSVADMPVQTVLCTYLQNDWSDSLFLALRQWAMGTICAKVSISHYKWNIFLLDRGELLPCKTKYCLLGYFVFWLNTNKKPH